MATRVIAPIVEPTYEVLSSLGEGATAELHVVRHGIFRNRRVRKRVDLFGVDEAIGLIEPRLLQAIRHDNIVSVHEAHYDPAFPGTRPLCFYMDYYPERSVFTAFRKHYGFPILDAVRIVRDVLDALAYVHDVHGYIHRDVKPANILLAKGRTMGLLTDFGEAAAIGDDGMVSAAGGSVLYHAPEWATGRVGPTADIYALGMVLHEMLNGALDYTKYNGDEASDRIKKGRRAIPDADLIPAVQVPDRLTRIVHRAMHRDPRKRYQRPADFRAALMASRVISWRRTAEGWEGPDSGTPCVYRVQAEPRRLELRLSVMRQTHAGGPWRRFGIDDRDIAANDRDGYAVFFDDVLARAFQRRAT